MTVGWQILVKVFIRKDAKPTFLQALDPLPGDVHLQLLEELGFDWETWARNFKSQSEKLSD
jgi:hypothetical protein